MRVRVEKWRVVFARLATSIMMLGLILSQGLLVAPKAHADYPIPLAFAAEESVTP